MIVDNLAKIEILGLERNRYYEKKYVERIVFDVGTDIAPSCRCCLW